MCNEIIVMMRYSTYRRSGTLQLYCTVPLAFPYATQFDRTIHTSVAVTLQSVRKYLLLMRSSSVVAVVYCCGFQHYKVYDEVSSGYCNFYFIISLFLIYRSYNFILLFLHFYFIIYYFYFITYIFLFYYLYILFYHFFIVILLYIFILLFIFFILLFIYF